MLLAVGLNVVVGFAGLLDLGYFGFFAVGAYTVALLTSPEQLISRRYWPWLAAVPVAIAADDDLRGDARLRRRCGCAVTTWPS